MSEATTPALPGPESLGGRILAFYKRNKLEEYTRTELSRTWDVSAGAITHALAPLLAAEWLAERTDGSGNRLVIAGPKLGDVELTPGAKIAETLSVALSPKKPKRDRLPPLDLSKLVVQKGQLAVPRLGGRGAKGGTMYAEMFEKLTEPNTWIEFDSAYAASLNKAMLGWRKTHPLHVFRLIKVSDTKHHLQRLPDKKEGAPA